MDFPQLIGGYSTEFSSKADIQSTKNLRLSRLDSGAGRNAFAMYMNYGLKQFYSATGGQMCRGLFELNDHVFDIVDGTIYDLISAGTVAASYGPIVNDFLICSFDASLNSFFVVSGNTLYRINGGALTTPATPFTPIAVGVLSTYVVAINASTNQFYFSTDDGATWPALNVQRAEAYPNVLLNLVVDHQELWLFGNRRTQVFVVGTNPDAPFVPVSAGVIEMGLAAARAVCKLDNSIFWLGRNKDGDGIMWRADGYSPRQVSNSAVENIWQTYGDLSDATMEAFQLNSACLRITFPSANGGLGATWEYDVKANVWTECAWWNLALSRYERHRANCYVSAWGKILAGDYANGGLYEMGPDIYTDFGYPIRWERRTPHVTKDGKRVQYKRFDLFMQSGTGSNTPVWLNDHSQDRTTFDASVAALVAAGTITIQQALIITNIYLYQLYAQSPALPGSADMTPLGFYDIANSPEVAMRYSNDGGETYTGFKYRAMGQSGNYSKRTYWGGVGTLGQARDRVWEISGMSPVKTAIVQGCFDGEALPY